MHRRLLAVAGLAALHVACAPPPVPPVVVPPAPTCPAPASSPPATPPQPGPVASASGSAAPAAPPSAPQEPPAPPAALQNALDAAAKATAAGDGAGADLHLTAADAAAAGDAHFAYLVARLRAVRFVRASDFERAASAFLAVLPALAKRTDLPDEFWSHNAMMMIREAQGDPAAALAENDQATLCAARGTWDPSGRETLAFQKDRWHRAYLTRMLAESRTGSVKQALVAYAQSALDEYRTTGFPESVAVLEAYFAALDGRREAALAAARRVDPSKDDDAEDLYLVVVGLEAGGDHAGAEAARRVIRRPGGLGISRAIMSRWLDLDLKPPAAHGFTPLHAGAR